MKLKKFTYFYPEAPELILIESDAFTEMSNDDNYIAEPKFNEQRCELHLIDGVVHFWDRHGKSLSYDSNPMYADGREKIAKIIVDTFGDKGYFLLDAGLRHNKVEGINNKLVIYDIHVYQNEVLNKWEFEERRAVLELNFKNTSPDDTVHLIEWHLNDFHKWFKYYAEHPSGEFEGLVMKNRKGKLKLSRTSNNKSLWMFKTRIKTGRHRY